MPDKEKTKIITDIIEGLQALPIDTYLRMKFCLSADAADSPSLTRFLNEAFKYVEARQPKLLVMK